jgi:hypothetical protein
MSMRRRPYLLLLLVLALFGQVVSAVPAPGPAYSCAAQERCVQQHPDRVQTDCRDRGQCAQCVGSMCLHWAALPSQRPAWFRPALPVHRAIPSARPSHDAPGRIFRPPRIRSV